MILVCRVKTCLYDEMEDLNMGFCIRVVHEVPQIKWDENVAFLLSLLRKFFIKSLLDYCVSELILKVGWYLWDLLLPFENLF